MSRPRDVRSRFGHRLRALRKLRSLTQENLGERASVSSKFIGQVERGEANPSLDVIDRLATALDISVLDLFSFEETQASAKPARTTAALVAEKRAAAYTYLSRRSPNQIERALRILEAVFGDPPKASR